MPFFCIKKQIKKIIRLWWGDLIIYKLEYKKIIIFLTIGLMLIVTLLWHKQEKTNKVIPKRAQYVLNIGEWRNNNV